MRRLVACGLIGLLLFAVGCSSLFGDNSGEQTPEDPQAAGPQGSFGSLSEGEIPSGEGDEGWYNAAVFKPLFGDFQQAQGLHQLPGTYGEQLYARGSYIARAQAACNSCHASSEDGEGPLAGGRELRDRFGQVFAANITPDHETGIGSWNLGELVRAIRASIDKQGKALSLDAHRGYRWMSDKDALSVAVYLKAEPAVEKQIQRRDISGMARRSWGIFSQHKEFEGYVPELPEKVAPQYGRYLVYHVSGCARCHSPVSSDPGDEIALSGISGPSQGLFSAVGALVGLLVAEPAYTPEKQELVRGLLSEEGKEEYQAQIDSLEPSVQEELKDTFYQAVSWMGVIDESSKQPSQIPGNIRGSAADGLLDWKSDQIVEYLTSGKTPTGKQVQGTDCPWTSYRFMNQKDKTAIALYLKQLS